ncbi:glutathione S-transferase 1-like [Gigantopelta aegis]|uniref:glutathione S-transferase 1-like n=1 Tax=Gigantopelta aegis TaxID=1735272 RepID=UPI001B88B7FA|nr:glutathione S-transferase 1-like [Gigantopelta aegis]
MAEEGVKKVKLSKMKLYYHPYYRSTRCVWLIKELGVDDEFELIKIDTMKRESAERKEYQKNVHPHGTVPALVIEGETTLLESGAICLYLADKYGRLAPDLKDRKDYYDWILHSCATMDEMMEVFYNQWIITPEKPDEELVQKTIKKFLQCMDALNKTLKGRKFVCGDSLTAADCVLGYSIWGAATMKDGLLVKDYPEVQQYYDRLKSRKAFQEAIAETPK